MTFCNRHSVRRLRLVLVLLGLLLSGCQSTTLPTKYADSRGDSINGINGFVELIKSTGRRADIWAKMSPGMATNYRSIVVFVSQYGAIPEETVAQVEQLLEIESLDTLIIVVRDSDSSIDYWEQVAAMPDLTAQHIEDARQSRDEAIRELESRTHAEFDPIRGGWYGLERVERTDESRVRTIEIADENPTQIQARWRLNRRLILAEDAEVLWSSQDDPLLTREESGNVMVLASAAPILNGGLVDPGNRQLAEKLVQMLPENEPVAIAVSSRWVDDSLAESPSEWRFLKIHPHGWIFGQTVLAIAIFCWWKLPIFGRPRSMLDTETVRFGRHVEALGNMLQRTRDADFARETIRNWQRGEKSTRDVPSDAGNPQEATT